MKKESLNLSQHTKTWHQKDFQIKSILILLIILAGLIFLSLELQFRKPVILEGTILPCKYSGYDLSCSYLKANEGNFLLTEGSIDKIRQSQPTINIYSRRVRLTGFLSRQTVAVDGLGKTHRFQIENLEFLD